MLTELQVLTLQFRGFGWIILFQISGERQAMMIRGLLLTPTKTKVRSNEECLAVQSIFWPYALIKASLQPAHPLLAQSD